MVELIEAYNSGDFLRLLVFNPDNSDSDNLGENDVTKQKQKLTRKYSPTRQSPKGNRWAKFTVFGVGIERESELYTD